MKKLELSIEGMHCTGCSTRLEKVLNNLDGVEKAEVNFEEKLAIVEYLEEKISVSEIKEAIEDAGFEVKGE